MRLSRLFHPSELLARLALAAARRRRWRRLRGTPAAALELGHIDSLELLELLAPHPPAVIYDVGANVGTWTCLAKSLFPAARIDAFEPLSAHQADFQARTAPFTDVNWHAVALGSSAATLEMNVMNFSDASSFLPLAATAAAEFNLTPVRRESIAAFPLDHFRQQNRLPAPDLIKLDVQGFELEVLRGAVATLRTTRAILIEVSFREYYNGQPLFHEVAAFLAGHGFRLHALAGTTPVGQPLGQTDALFVNTSSPLA